MLSWLDLIYKTVVLVNFTPLSSPDSDELEFSKLPLSDTLITPPTVLFANDVTVVLKVAVVPSSAFPVEFKGAQTAVLKWTGYVPDETKVHSSLSHPNIVSLYDFHHGRYTLDELLPTLEPKEISRIVTEVNTKAGRKMIHPDRHDLRIKTSRSDSCHETVMYLEAMASNCEGLLPSCLDKEAKLRVSNLFEEAVNAGLRYLADNGIVHGDLRTRNVLVSSGGMTAKGEPVLVLKIADFGESSDSSWEGETESEMSPLIRQLHSERTGSSDLRIMLLPFSKDADKENINSSGCSSDSLALTASANNRRSLRSKRKEGPFKLEVVRKESYATRRSARAGRALREKRK